MRLTTRITIAIGACALLLFGGGGLLQLRGEERDLRRVAEAEAMLLGRSLQTAFENALRDRQIEDVAETLEALSGVDRAVAIFVYDEKGKLVGASLNSRPSADTVRVEVEARRTPQPVVEFLPRDSPTVLRLGLRLRYEVPESASSIVLEKPLTEMQRDLRATRRNIWLITLAFVIAVAGLTWFLTHRYVEIPLARMISNMRRVRAGDLRVVPAARTADEVGETQREFDVLVQELEVARQRANQESDARRRIELGLQGADKLITLGQLSAVMAHEIGSPLQVLEGRARALRKHAHDPEATRRIADVLVEQTERITRIVSQMLSITRRRAPVRMRIDAETSVRSVVALLELEARRRRVRLEIEVNGDTDVYADADQLQQVALNLIRNALDAAPADSIVKTSLSGNGDSLVLEVSDAGAGISASARPHLFEPFFTTKASSGGSGLGLSVVKSIVDEHGGQVDVSLNEPTGCIARVTLPRRVEGCPS